MNEQENVQKRPDGLPAQLKANVEAMSGFNMDDVIVHYNSSKPAQMKARAHTQGTDIHVPPGQERHLGHETWHVVQQKQGRVAPTAQLKGVNVNTDDALEHEADVMGARASIFSMSSSPVVQRKKTNGQQDAPMQFQNHHYNPIDLKRKRSTNSGGTSAVSPQNKRRKTEKNKQEIADQAALNYNKKHDPFGKAQSNNCKGVSKTKNCGVSFKDSPELYKENKKTGIVNITAQGKRNKDFNVANSKLGLNPKPKGYTWHHVDDYNVKERTMTLELVKTDVHKKTIPHAGGCMQYDAVNGSSYNKKSKPPVKRVV